VIDTGVKAQKHTSAKEEADSERQKDRRSEQVEPAANSASVGSRGRIMIDHSG
jgi:hypothetical protein